MSKEKLQELIAPLSVEERRELREILDEVPRTSDKSEDPMMKVLRQIDEMPPMPVPPDFSANFRNYRDGVDRSEP